MNFTDENELKKYLLKGFFIEKELKSIKNQIRELEEMKTTLKTMNFGIEKVQASPKNENKLDSLLDDINYLQKGFLNKCRKLYDHKKDIMLIIETISDDIIRVIMFERYINLKSWEQVAVDSFYTWRWVHTLHSRGLKIIFKESIKKHSKNIV